MLAGRSGASTRYALPVAAVASLRATSRGYQHRRSSRSRTTRPTAYHSEPASSPLRRLPCRCGNRRAGALHHGAAGSFRFWVSRRGLGGEHLRPQAAPTESRDPRRHHARRPVRSGQGNAGREHLHLKLPRPPSSAGPESSGRCRSGLRRPRRSGVGCSRATR